MNRNSTVFIDCRPVWPGAPRCWSFCRRDQRPWSSPMPQVQLLPGRSPACLYSSIGGRREQRNTRKVLSFLSFSFCKIQFSLWWLWQNEPLEEVFQLDNSGSDERVSPRYLIAEMSWSSNSLEVCCWKEGKCCKVGEKAKKTLCGTISTVLFIFF